MDKIAFIPHKKKSQKKKPSPSPQKENNVSHNYNDWRKKTCFIAIENLELLNASISLGVDDGNGGERLMTPLEKKEQIEKMSNQKKLYCSPKP
jgi:hypothetical protein